MGRPMAKNLLSAGYSLFVHDINEEATLRLVSEGAREAENPKEIAEVSDVIITMVPDSSAVETVVFGTNGLSDGVRDGQLYIDMSTILPSTSIHVALELGKKGLHCLDAPVSGGEIGATEAILSIMVGGNETVFNETLPIFQVLGKTITLCGLNGAGQVVKACNQVASALILLGMAEALTLGAKAGVDPTIIINVLSGGAAQSRLMDIRGHRIIQGDFLPGFMSKYHHKDLGIALQTARENEVPLPGTALVETIFTSMLAAGRGDLDTAGILTILEDLAHVQARTKIGAKTKV